MDLKGILRHIYKIRFSFFSAVLSAFGLVSKKCMCKYKQKKIFCTIRYGYLKTQNSMLSSNSLKEMLKGTPKRSYRPETFAYSNKSKKLNFSVAFLLITKYNTFFAWIFLQFFQRIRNQHTVIHFRLSWCLIWHLHHHGCNWDTCWNCVHPSVLFDSTWVAVQKTKKIKNFSRIEPSYPGLPVLYFTTTLPLLTCNWVLSTINMGGGRDGSGCQSINFSHHGSFWLHIFLKIRPSVRISITQIFMIFHQAVDGCKIWFQAQFIKNGFPFFKLFCQRLTSK